MPQVWIIDRKHTQGQELSHILKLGNHSITLQGSAGDIFSRPSRTQVMVRTQPPQFLPQPQPQEPPQLMSSMIKTQI